MRHALILLVIFGHLTKSVSEERIFTNKDGKKIIAEIETIRDGQVFLKMNSNRFAVPFLDLSISDQEYLREWIKSNFDFRFNFQIREVENPDLKPAERIGKSKTDYSSWRYSVEVENRSGIVADELRAEYQIYKRLTNSRGYEEAIMTKGNADIGKIEHTRKASIETPWIEMTSKRWESLEGSTRMDGFSSVTQMVPVTSRSSEKLDGIWIRIYRGEKMLAEHKSEGKMIKNAVWQAPLNIPGQVQSLPKP